MAKNNHDEHKPNVKLYLGIGAALFALTFVTVLISKLHLEKGPAVALGLAVALVKASLVAAVFMHLWGEKKLIHRVLYVTAAAAALVAIVFWDRNVRGAIATARVSVAEQGPAKGAH